MRRGIGDERLRSEVGWVILNKAAELVLLFGLLKLLTNGIGKAGYGEYNITDTALLLVSSVVLAPVHQAFLRDYHGSHERDEARGAAVYLIRWFGLVTLAIALVGMVFSRQLAAWFELSPWTPFAAGVLFLTERWRLIGQDILNIQRRRKHWALANLAFIVSLIAAIAAVVEWGPASAPGALFAYAAVAGVFGIGLTAGFLRDVVRLPRGLPSGLAKLTLGFGVPYAALLVFQWIQGFGDRYLVKALLDAESVGLYVAAYQVCGVPFALILRIAHDLLTPVAYRRAQDATDPVQFWSADKLLIGGIAIQIVAGLAMLVFYAFFGQWLLIFLTNDQFELPATTLVLLAAARFAQSMSFATQPIFAVHHRLSDMLWFRCFGAVLNLGICAWAIARHGIPGAALGTLLATGLYLVALVFGPRGCWWLVAGVRSEALGRR